ncbi:MAG TPA: hypothetical protein VGQ18_12155 [Gemmatimonadales bacterium]|nr:hypothetical protein [Gemmatimonadales bacterium]
MITLLAAVLYVVISLVSVEFDRASGGGVHPWRLAAWVASAVVAATQIWYEHFRLTSPPLKTALRAAASVALGAFGLAVSAYLHSLRTPGQHASPIAFLAWPVITGVPAFLAALGIAMVLARFSPRS